MPLDKEIQLLKYNFLILISSQKSKAPLIWKVRRTHVATMRQCCVMRLLSCLLVFLLLLFFFSTVAATPRSPGSGSNTYLTKDELWFSQTLDHYSPFVLLTSPIFQLNAFFIVSFIITFTQIKRGNFERLVLNKFFVKFFMDDSSHLYAAGSSQFPAALLWVPWLFQDSGWTCFFGDMWWIFVQWDQKWLY